MSSVQPNKPTSEFEVESQKARNNFFAEFWNFLKHNKKWWLLPILIVMVLVGVLVALSATAAASFIYPLF